MSETIGLDIGSHSMKLVGLTMTSRGPFLTHGGMKVIPSEVDREDMNYLSEILKVLLREVGIKPTKARLTVCGSGVDIRRIIIPSMPKTDLKEAIRWEIKRHLSFAVESAHIDFHIVNEFEGDGVKELDVIVVACPIHLVDRTLSIAKGAGLRPTHLDVGPFALWNALLSRDRFEEEVIALIDLGAGTTGIHLFKSGILQLYREITPAGDNITRAIMEGIGPEEEANHLYDRAEVIKQKVGIPSEADHEEMIDESTKLSRISFLVRPVLERLAAEIRRSLDYCRSQLDVERIDRLLLTGGGANLKNIAPYLGDELRLPVERLNPFGAISLDSKKMDAQVVDQTGPLFTVATGVALPQPERIELLPAREPFFSRVRMRKLIPNLAPLVTLLVFAWIVWGMNGEVAALKKEHDTKMTRVTTFEALQTKLMLSQEKKMQLQGALSLFPSSVIVPVPCREVLREVSHIVPPNVTLTLLAIQSETKPSQGESESRGKWGIDVAGLAFGSDLQRLTALARVVDRLEKSPLFKNAQLVSADENKAYNRPAAEFEIVCDIDLSGRKRADRTIAHGAQQ